MSNRAVSILIAVSCVFVVLAGKLICQDELVRGGVFLDGQPLSQADLFFVGNDTVNGAMRSFARTDSSGRYEITKPLPPGEYRVVVRRLLGDSVESESVPTEGESVIDSTQTEARTNALRETARRQNRYSSRHASIATSRKQLPEIYSSPEHTVLRVHVPESGSAEIDLHLSLEGTHRIATELNSNGPMQ